LEEVESEDRLGSRHPGVSLLLLLLSDLLFLDNDADDEETVQIYTLIKITHF
jgi:hypothetical protein